MRTAILPDRWMESKEIFYCHNVIIESSLIDETQTMKKLTDGPKTPAFLQKIQWIADPLGYMEARVRASQSGLTKGFENADHIIVIHRSSFLFLP